MRLLVLFAATLLAGCAAIHELDEYSIADGQRAGTEVPPHSPNNPSLPSQTSTISETGCTSNRTCMAIAGEGVTAVCVHATGRCMQLTTPECPSVVGDPTHDDALVLGTILGSSDEMPSVHEQATVLAAEEIGLARPLVVVGCRASGNVIEATRHLVEGLHVPAIIGPVAGEDVVAVTQQVTVRGGTLVMTPTSPVSAISNLADDDLTWRAVPSDVQRAKLVIQQINELETLLQGTRSLTSVKLGIIHPTDALGTSARDAIATKLILNGRFILDAANASFVSVDAYSKGDADAQTEIASRWASTFRPDIVLITSAEQVDSLMVPLESALTAARVVNRPYYLLGDTSKTEALLERIASGAFPADIKRRVRGVGVKPDATSAPILDDFSAAFVARFGAAPPTSALATAAAAYDAMYSITYAVAATPDVPLSGKRVAQGLRTLAVGDLVAVGPHDVVDVVTQLSFRQSISLHGTFGPMEWDASGDIRAGTLEVWCVGTRDNAPVFGSSGLTMGVQTQVVGGSFVQCQ